MLTLGVTTTSRPCACTAPTYFILGMNVYGPVPTANVLDRLGQACRAAGEWTKAETAWRSALCGYEAQGRTSEAWQVLRRLAALERTRAGSH
jgi:hypothetical protein